MAYQSHQPLGSLGSVPRNNDLGFLSLATKCDPKGVSSCSSVINDIIASMLAGDIPNQSILIDGRFRTTEPLLIDRSALVADPILGARTQISFVGYGAAHGQLVSDHNGACIDYRGNSGDGVRSLLKWGGFGLYGPSRAAGSRGILTDKLVFFDFDNVDLNNFEYGFKSTDTFLGSFNNVRMVQNKYGIRMEANSFSGPNAVTFRNVTIGHNKTYGAYLKGGSGISFIGGSVEGNGTDGISEDTGSFGMLLTETGGYGQGVLSMSGTYFEGNKGYADLWLDSYLLPSTYSVTGCTFNRTSSTQYTLLQIAGSCGSTGAGSICHVAGNGFGAFGTYTDNGSRPNIGGTINMFADGGGNRFSALQPTDVFAPRTLGLNPIANLPNPVGLPGAIVAVTNGDAGNICLAMSDGSTWRRIVLGATVAAS